jgi:hypothetical protein
MRPIRLLRTRRLLTGSAAVAALAAGVTLGTDAQARPNIKRQGGQWGIMLGGSACIPGKADCSRDGVSEGGITIDGSTQPSFGLGAELGYRFNRFVFLGAAYNLGFFNTDYEVIGGSGYRRAYQNSVYAEVRPILPVWRFDFGLGLAPGWSRQTFVLQDDDKDYSQGFSWKFAPTIDVWVSRRIFIGAKADIILNAHGRTCRQRGSTTTCQDTTDRDVAPVHQTIFGLHIGGSFL